MRVTVTVLISSKIFTLEISEDIELQNFKALCEEESQIPSAEMVIVFNGTPLTDNIKGLKEYGVKDNDIVILNKANNEPTSSLVNPNPIPMLDFSQIGIPNHLTEEMRKVLKEQQEARNERERLRLRMLTADPMDMEAQRLIAQEIENKNIETNMELAMEYNPESFGTVVMLYIDCKVNGHYIKAFVDSGAQATIMSQNAAERCNISRLIDRRWKGIAKGVGTQKIIGRVHIAQIQVEKDFLPSSFLVLEEQPMDMLLGLDMLKRHQCNIDLKNNVLVIGSTGTTTPFLSEAELPPCARQNFNAQEDIDEVLSTC